MTVLQQVKDYCLRYAHPSAALVKDVMQKIVPVQATKPAVAPNDNQLADSQSAPAASPHDGRGRFISKQV
jgi:hypothetical protein